MKRSQRLACIGLIALLFVVTTGFGIFSTGSSRIWAAVLAAGISLLLLGLEWFDQSPIEGRPPASIWLFALLAGALYGNIGWVPSAAVTHLLTGILWIVGAVAALQALARVTSMDPARSPTVVSTASLWPVILIAAGIYYTGVVIAVPRPHIDVWHHMNSAGDSLLAGINPYEIFTPDFYRGRTAYGFDTPGFPYPPAVLLVATLAQLLSIDVRLLFMLCLLVTASLCRQIARDSRALDQADLLGALLLFAPRQSFIIKYSHSEPISGLLMALMTAAQRRGHSTAAAIFLGLFASSKQYLVVAAPLLALYSFDRGSLGTATAAAVTPWIPFALCNPKALWDAVFAVHLGRPPRADGMTINAWLMSRHKPPLPGWVALVCGSLVSLGFALRRRTSIAQLLVGLAATLIVTLVLSPQAFSNYYLLACWVTLAALGAAGRSEEGAQCA